MQKKLFIGFLTLLLGGLFFLQLGLLPAQANSPLTYPITNPISSPYSGYPTTTPTPPTDYPIIYPITYPITYVEPVPTTEEPTITPSVSPEPQKSNSGNSQSSNDTKHNNSCGDAAPTSAPYLVSAIPSGKNQVMLFWNKATDPVTHYAIVYGTASGKEQYGVLHAGGRDAAMFTIDNLSGGTTYYFRVRAVNGCMNSALSNELSVKASGKVIKNNGVKNKVMGVSAVNKAKQAVKNSIIGTKANKKSIVFDVSENRIVSTAKAFFNTIKGFFTK